jgi:hypothetical protein
MDIPGYQTGPQDDRWMYGIFFDMAPGLGVPVAEGSARTEADGTYTLKVDNPAVSERLGREIRKYTLEVTLQDESGLPVSARSEIVVDPADFYIGVHLIIWVTDRGGI